MRREVKLGLAALGLLALGIAGKGSVDYMDQNMKPRYELKGNPAPPITEFDEPIPWQRPTQWIKNTNTRIHFIDGRDGTKRSPN